MATAWPVRWSGLCSRAGHRADQDLLDARREVPRPRAQPAARGEPQEGDRAGASQRSQPGDCLGRRRGPLLLHRRWRYDRADACSPASDERDLSDRAEWRVVKPRIYVLHFSSDGSPASATRLEADFEVYTLTAYRCNFLLSGVQRDAQNRTMAAELHRRLPPMAGLARFIQGHERDPRDLRERGEIRCE